VSDLLSIPATTNPSKEAGPAKPNLPDWTQPTTQTVVPVDWKTARIVEAPPEVAQPLSAADDPQGLYDEMQANQVVSDFTGLSIPQVDGNLEPISEALYGEPLDAPGLFSRIVNSWEFAELNRQKNKLGARMALGIETPEDVQKLAEINAKLPKADEMMKTVPNTVLNLIHQLYTGAKTVAIGDTSGDAGEVAKRSLLNLGLQVVGSMVSPAAAVATGGGGRLVKDMTEQSIGGYYLSLIEAGVDPTISRWTTGALTAMDTALNVLPMMSALGAGKQAAVQVAKGAIAKGIAKNVLATVGKQVAVQGAYGYGGAVIHAMLPEVAKALSEAVTNGECTFRDAKDLLTQIGIEGTINALPDLIAAGGSIAGTLRIKRGGNLDIYLKEQIKAQIEQDKFQMGSARQKNPTADIIEGMPKVETPEMKVEAEVARVTKNIGELQDMEAAFDAVMATKKTGKVELIKAKTKGEMPEVFKPVEADSPEFTKIADEVMSDTSPLITEAPETVAARAKIEELETKLAATKDKASAEAVQLKDAITSARKEANIVANLVKQDWQTKLGAYRETILSRQKVNKYIRDIKAIDESKLLPEFAEPIKKIKEVFTTENFNKNTQADLGLVKSMLDTMAIDNKEISPDMLRLLGEYDKTPLRSLPPDDLKVIRDAIVQYDHLAKEANQIRVAGEIQERARVVDKAVEDLPKVAQEETRIEMREQADGSMKAVEVIEKPDLGAKFRDSVRNFKNTSTYKMIPFADMVERLGKTPKKVILDGMHEGSINTMKDVQATNAEFKQRTASIPKINDWLNEPASFAVNDTQMADLTRAYKLSLYMHAKNAQNRAHLTGGDTSGFNLKFSKYSKGKSFKVTDAALDTIVKEVNANPQEKLYVDTVSDMLSKMGKKQAEVYARRNGIPMAIVDNYYRIETVPLARSMSAAEKASARLEQSTEYGVGPEQGQTKERTGATGAIYLNPITHDFAISRDVSAEYVHMSDPSSNAVKLIKDPKFAKELAKIEPDLQRNLIKALRDMNHIHDPVPDIDMTALKIRNNMGIAILGLPNEWPVMKQFIAIQRYSMYVDSKNLMAGVIEAATSPRKSRAFMESVSPEFVDRIEGGQSREIADILRTSKTSRGLEMVGGKTWRQKLMTGTRWGDAAVVQAGMLGAYKKVMGELQAGELSPIVRKVFEEQFYLDDAKIANFTPDDRMKWAAKYADYATEHTQAMAQPEFQSDFQRGTASQKALTLFMSENMASLNMFRRTLNEAKTRGSARAWGRVVKAGLIVFAGEQLANMAVNRLRREATGAKQPELGKDVTAALLNAPLQGVPVVGAMSQAIVNKTVLGWDSDNFALTPMQSAADLLLNLGEQIGDVATAPDGYRRKKAALAAADTLGQVASMATGIPYNSVKSNVKLGIRTYQRVMGEE